MRPAARAVRPSRAAVLPALLALLALAAGPAASAAALSETVGAGDAALGQTLVGRRATLGYLDLDLDQALDAAGPPEPLYLDADASGSVSFGDVRLTGLGDYPASSDVGPADTDNGRALAAVPGWLASVDGAWYADCDNSMTVTAGDLRLATGARVAPDDPELGKALARSSLIPTNQVDLRDADGDGRRDAGEGLYLDLDRSQAVSIGDVRLVSGRTAAGSSGSTSAAGGDGAGAGGDGDGGDDDPDAVETVPTRRGDGSLRGVDVFLLALGLVNLAGLVYVVRSMRSTRPRNPFK